MAKTKDHFYMAGTEKTGAYCVICKTARGRIGVRVLSGDLGAAVATQVARIRVETIGGNVAVNKVSAILKSEAGWKQPGDGGERRFSTVADTATDVKKALLKGLVALGVGAGLKVNINPNAAAWLRDLVGEAKQGTQPEAPAEAPALA